MSKKENFLKGIWKENPVLVSMLGLCPSLAITTKLENALGMGLAVMFVLVFSNLLISLLRKIVPDEIRIPIYIVVIATLVTVVDMLMAAYLPALSESLGLFIPLIVVNCIILGRAEAFASKNKPLDSVIDALGMSIGYTIVIAVIATIREIIGTGQITVWGDLVLNINKLFGASDGYVYPIFSDFYVKPAGAFIVLGIMFGILGIIKNNNKKKSEAKEVKN